MQARVRMRLKFYPNLHVKNNVGLTQWQNQSLHLVILYGKNDKIYFTYEVNEYAIYDNHTASMSKYK